MKRQVKYASRMPCVPQMQGDGLTLIFFELGPSFLSGTSTLNPLMEQQGGLSDRREQEKQEEEEEEERRSEQELFHIKCTVWGPIHVCVSVSEGSMAPK